MLTNKMVKKGIIKFLWFRQFALPFKDACIFLLKSMSDADTIAKSRSLYECL